MNKTFFALGLVVLASCTPPKPQTPALTPQAAAGLLQYNAKAKTWLMHVQKENPTCSYTLDLPDQTAHPTTIDVNHIVSCGGRPSPRALDATVTFTYDAQAGHWVVLRFQS
ncbi:MAG: hypothetical protein ACJ74Y_03410 [Bryobacteraceae bacterium]